MTLSSRRLSVSNFTVELLVCVRDEFTFVNVTRLGGYLHSESEHNLVLKCSRTFISYVLCILPSLSYVWTFLCMSWHSSCLTSTWPCYLKTALHYTDMSNLLVNLELHKAFRFWLTVRQVNGQTDRNVPEDDDESVEDVEADTDVSTEPVGNHLQQHFNGEQPAEEHVAVLEELRQRRRLQPTKRCSW